MLTISIVCASIAVDTDDVVTYAYWYILVYDLLINS
jgi:hypothetical protein